MPVPGTGSFNSLAEALTNAGGVVIAIEYKAGCSSLNGFNLVDVALGVGIPYRTGVLK